jgi:hypothetical protein
MNKYLTITISISLTVFMIACKSKTELQNEKLQIDLQTYFTENLEDSTSKLDSFFLIKVDTISQQMLLFEQSSVLNSQLEYLIDIYKLNTQKLSNSVDQIRLYRMIGSQDLVDIEKKDFDKQKEKGVSIKSEIDTVMAVIKRIDSTANLADTTKPVGFQAKCLYQVRLKDKSIKRDTTFILLNTNKDIIKRNDFLNLPYKIDYDKFD